MNDRENNKPARRKTGFYAALYGGVGVLLLTAAVIAFFSFMTPKKEADNESGRKTDIAGIGGDAAEVDVREETGGAFIDEQARKTPPPPTIPTPRPTETPTPRPRPTVTPPPQPPVSWNDEPVGNDDEYTALEYSDPFGTVSITDNDEPVDARQETERTFASFTDSDRMEWPVFGDILMDYSVDHLIFDKTLAQYRTNDVLCIAADLGADVKAAAAGRVLDLKLTRESGKTVVIGHGNGWSTTYSQLGSVNVNVGDVVEAGDVIGTIGEPSIYKVLLGSHLGFTVAKDDAVRNPKDLLR